MANELSFKNAKEMLEEAEIGKGGLKRMIFSTWRRLTLGQRRELLEQGAVIMTGEDVDAVVEIRVEDYFAICPPTNNPLKKPRMKMFEGALFREVM